MMRNLQAQSGGSLMLGGTTFRHFSHATTINTGTNSLDINVSARVRSLEALLFVSNTTANLTDKEKFSLSSGSTLGGTSGNYNVFVGAKRYPSNQISFDTRGNKGECYQELRKCFGALGAINHGGFLNNVTYLSVEDGRVTNAGGSPAYGCCGISFRSIRHELEDGIDTSSQALPIRLELQSSTAGGATTLDIYAQATILFYFNLYLLYHVYRI